MSTSVQNVVVPGSSVCSSASPLVSALADDAAKERRANFVRYAELLAASMPVPGEPAETVPPDPRRVAQLKQLAAALGRSPAQVEADAVVIQQVKAHRATMARSAGYQDKSAAADRAVKEYDAETVRVLEERRREYRRLYAVYSNIGFTWSGAMHSMRELNRLLDKNPEVLAHEPPATQRDCE